MRRWSAPYTTSFRAAEADGLRYATFKRVDAVTFVHIAEMEEGTNPLSGVAAFREFPADLPARCDDPPAATDLSEVDSYNFFEGGSR